MAQLTERWGTRQTAAGKTIWAELAVPTLEGRAVEASRTGVPQGPMA